MVFFECIYSHSRNKYKFVNSQKAISKILSESNFSFSFFSNKKCFQQFEKIYFHTNSISNFTQNFSSNPKNFSYPKNFSTPEKFSPPNVFSNPKKFSTQIFFSNPKTFSTSETFSSPNFFSIPKIFLTLKFFHAFEIEFVKFSGTSTPLTFRKTYSSLARITRHYNENHIIHRIPSNINQKKLKKLKLNQYEQRLRKNVSNSNQYLENQYENDSLNESGLEISTEQEKLTNLFSKSDLVITREVEYANLIFGFEQQNRYIIIDPHSSEVVGFILEKSNLLLRQFLRTRRNFTAKIFNAKGEEIFSVRRPFFFITSTIYVEFENKVIGEVHRRFHLWKRKYDAYVFKKQFAEVNNPGFWYWTFSLNDKNGQVLAEIDRNWRGLGYELFTDAGQYVIRFGGKNFQQETKNLDEKKMVSKNLKFTQTQLHNLAVAANSAPALDVSRPLNLFERAVSLALAISLDNDYFSRQGGGVGFFPILGESE